MMMPSSLESLEQQRIKIVEQIVQLHDLRRGSPHVDHGPLWQAQLPLPSAQTKHPTAPNLRMTFKVASKTVTESLPDPAAVLKAKREIAEFRRFEQLIREFVDVNAQICHSRPAEQTTESSLEKKRPRMRLIGTGWF